MQRLNGLLDVLEQLEPVQPHRNKDGTVNAAQVCFTQCIAENGSVLGENMDVNGGRRLMLMSVVAPLVLTVAALMMLVARAGVDEGQS